MTTQQFTEYLKQRTAIITQQTEIERQRRMWRKQQKDRIERLQWFFNNPESETL